MLTMLFLGLLLALDTGPEPRVLLNPSFEDPPAPGYGASGWYPCGAAEDSPPDIHPSGAFGVTRPAAHGKAYLGMVVRDNGSTEALGQRLSEPIPAHTCFTFSLFLARSAVYRSASRLTGFLTPYTQPAVLRLWGSKQVCAREVLLAESTPIEHADWRRYTFHFQSDRELDYFFLEAFFPGGTRRRGYCGNILLDGCSPILPADCATGAPLAEVDTLDLPLTPSREPFAAYVGQLADSIRFAPATSALLPGLFVDRSGKLCQHHPSLQLLVEGLAAHPDFGLLAVLRGPDQRLADRRTRFLAAQMDLLGLPADRLDIRRWKRSDRRRSWDGVNADQDLYLKLEPRGN